MTAPEDQGGVDELQPCSREQLGAEEKPALQGSFCHS